MEMMLEGTFVMIGLHLFFLAVVYSFLFGVQHIFCPYYLLICLDLIKYIGFWGKQVFSCILDNAFVKYKQQNYRAYHKHNIYLKA